MGDGSIGLLLPKVGYVRVKQQRLFVILYLFSFFLLVLVSQPKEVVETPQILDVHISVNPEQGSVKMRR